VSPLSRVQRPREWMRWMVAGPPVSWGTDGPQMGHVAQKRRSPQASDGWRAS
jgi:hypothetical protein